MEPTGKAAEKGFTFRHFELIAIGSLVAIGALGFLLLQRGRDRAVCILNQRNVQQAVRSYQGMYNVNFGSPTDWARIIGPGKYLDIAPKCPSGGTYTYKNIVPSVGELAVECSLCGAPDKHVPDHYSDW